MSKLVRRAAFVGMSVILLPAAAIGLGTFIPVFFVWIITGILVMEDDPGEDDKRGKGGNW